MITPTIKPLTDRYDEFGEATAAKIEIVLIDSYGSNQQGDDVYVAYMPECELRALKGGVIEVYNTRTRHSAIIPTHRIKMIYITNTQELDDESSL